MSTAFSSEGPVVFFDGACNFCNGAVDFIMRHEKAPVLRFAALQSAYARRVLGDDAATSTSIILRENGVTLTRSDAALRAATYMRAPWSSVAPLRFLPSGPRDAVYALVARFRYRLFGTRACRLDDPRYPERFLSA